MTPHNDDYTRIREDTLLFQTEIKMVIYIKATTLCSNIYGSCGQFLKSQVLTLKSIKTWLFYGRTQGCFHGPPGIRLIAMLGTNMKISPTL